MHAPQALASNPVLRPTSYLPAQPSMCSAYGSNEIPDAVRQSVIQEYPRLGFKREFAGFSEPKPSKSLVAAPGTCTASPSAT